MGSPPYWGDYMLNLTGAVKFKSINHFNYYGRRNRKTNRCRNAKVPIRPFSDCFAFNHY